MIEKRPNGRYRVRIYRRGRYVASRTFHRKSEAAAWERRQLDALAAGTWVRPADGDVTVSEWVEAWWAGRQANKPSTSARYRGLLDQHVLPRWGRLPITAISRGEVQQWATRLAAGKSPSTARQALGLLRGALDAAVNDGVLQRNPAVGVRLPRMPRSEPSPLTHGELWKLADAMPTDRDRVLTLVMGYGGLRWGEVTALRVRDVQQRGAELRLREAVAEVGGHLHVGTLKDHETRTVVLPATVATELASWIKAKDSNALVFPSATRTYLRNGSWRRNVLNPVLEATGLPQITPHNLRDTAATLAINAGASVMAVAQLLGHETPSTTLRHYAGTFPTDLGDIAKKLDRAARTAKNKSRRREGAKDAPTRDRP
nr:site-specific integrase [Flexivirga meconopsidis]